MVQIELWWMINWQRKSPDNNAVHTEPPIARFANGERFSGGPVTAVVICFRTAMLSARATEYLNRLERRPLISDAEEVRAVFASHSLPCPTAITDFQSRFGGIVMYASLSPMIATILHPQANFLLDRPWNVPDVSEDNGKLMFNCIDTLYQMEFHLDEVGQYYENWSPVHESFEKFLEAEAFLASHSKHGRWSMMAEPETEVGRDVEQLRRYGLEIDEFASCRYTTFWYNDAIIVRYRSGRVTAWRNEESQITKR